MSRLNELESKLKDAENIIDKSELNKKYTDAAVSWTRQKKTMLEYEDILRNLKMQVIQVKDIHDSIPESCVSETKLEPEG